MQLFHGKNAFPIASDQDLEKIKEIIINFSTIKEATTLAKTENDVFILEASLARICDYVSALWTTFLLNDRVNN